jgi:hypothetical protein
MVDESSLQQQQGETIQASPNAWVVLGASLGVLALVTLSYHKLESSRTRGRQWLPHAIYVAVAILVIVTLPTSVAAYIFSGLTVTVVGVVLPIYESIRAVCSPEEDDDKTWLQYWLVGGVLFMGTTWVKFVLSETVVVYWDTTMVFLFYWLYFPKTDGAVLIYETITEPYLAPKVRPLAMQMNNFIAYMYQTLINAAHLWLVWIIFLFLPKGLKRIVSVAIGTVYPLISSITAAATEEIEDDTYWLTYWSVYGCLFLVMDISETWLGWIPGFYTVIIFSTVYLMLPMFQGADKVFRKILVPLAGLQELIMLRDAIIVKKQMLKNLPPERAHAVRKAIAKFYANDDDSAAPAELKNELLVGWQGLKMPSIPNPFSHAKGDDSAATETTSLV